MRIKINKRISNGKKFELCSAVGSAPVEAVERKYSFVSEQLTSFPS